MSNNSIVNNSQLEDKRDDCPATTKRTPGLISAAEILATEWPDLDWVIQKLMPTGLSFLAGVPKIGKSWLSLQMAKTVATGESLLGQKATKGKVLYLALEDTVRRLQKRMQKQGWPNDIGVEFMTLVDFIQLIDDLQGDGAQKLAQIIKKEQFTLVIIDTLSRAISIDQNDVREVTRALSPLQAIAQEHNCSIVLIDHHKKLSGSESRDAIGDVLGSTAKGGVADTIMSLYRERGGIKAHLSITGRDIEDKDIEIVFDKDSGCWILANGVLTDELEQILELLEGSEPRTNQDIANNLEINPPTSLKRLAKLRDLGRVKQNVDKTWEISFDQE